MTRKLILGAMFAALTAVSVYSQTPTPTPNSVVVSPIAPASLETILSEAEKQTINYRQEFKNLLADETKTFERYDKNGQVKDKKVVESTLLVYQSARSEKVSSELRNITKVDGELVPDSQQRSDRFLAELQKQETPEKELEKLQKEGARYDKTLEIYGLTLSEAVVLSSNLRPFFDFQLADTENYKGNQVYVITYRQTRKSPYVTLNSGDAKPGELSLNFSLDLPKSLKNSDALLQGKLWIDSHTFQVWREERELTVQSPNPVVLLRTELDYQTSDYGILVPKQISLVTNNVKKDSGENQFTAVNDMRVKFDYSRFRKTDVDIKILDDQ